jgi:hypothetical protein
LYGENKVEEAERETKMTWKQSEVALRLEYDCHEEHESW